MPSTVLCQKTEKAIASRGTRCLSASTLTAQSSQPVSFGKYFDGTVISALVAQAQRRGGEDAAWWLLWVCGQEHNRSLGSCAWRWHDQKHARLFLGLYAVYRRSSQTVFVLKNHQKINLNVKGLVTSFYQHSDVKPLSFNMHSCMYSPALFVLQRCHLLLCFTITS
jgi:hypothetical protein